MPFQPEQLSESTFNGFVDRLLRFTKAAPPAPKRSWAQEAIARALGFPNYHAAQASLQPGVSKPTPAAVGQDTFAPHADQSSQPDQPFVRQSGLSIPFVSAGKTLASSLPFFDHSPVIVTDSQLSDNLLLLGDTLSRQLAVQHIVSPTIASGRPVFLVSLGKRLSAIPIPSECQQFSFSEAQDYAGALAPVFGRGTASELAKAIVDLMPDPATLFPSEMLWHHRAVDLVTVLSKVLVALRDDSADPLKLDADVFAEYCDIVRLRDLAYGHRLQPQVAKDLTHYLQCLPGFTPSLPVQPETTREQHDYLTMQFMSKIRSENPMDLRHKHIAITIEKEDAQARVLGQFINRWAVEHSRGLIVFEGMTVNSCFHPWLLANAEDLKASGHAVIVTARSVAATRIVASPLEDIIDHMGHWLVFKAGIAANNDISAIMTSARYAFGGRRHKTTLSAPDRVSSKER